MRFADLAAQALLVAALAVAAVPWFLEARPGESLLLGFALAPPLVLGVLLGLRERGVLRVGAPAATD